MVLTRQGRSPDRADSAIAAVMAQGESGIQWY
jgi:hypothetical protein